jgi:cell wall-associated NlpC family hydrolase
VPTVEQLIRRYAKKHGIDPRAAIAVAMGEGGLRYGAVGDQGTSYGPFQLHVGGALPQGRGPRWANSPAGIEYAIRKMAEAGARGLQGQAAINAIVRQFERPANPDASVQAALARYGQVAGGRMGRPAPRRRARAPGGGGIKQAGLNALLDIARGGSDPLATLNSLAAARKEAASTGGTLRPPKARGGRIPEAASPVINRVLQFAHKAIGTPYVWGGESYAEGGFDCSGLLDAAFRAAGIDLPGRLTSQSALGIGKSVKGKKLQPGDAIVTNGGRHVVLYAGGGKVIAAPHRGAVVRYQPLSDFRNEIVDVRRFI